MTESQLEELRKYQAAYEKNIPSARDPRNAAKCAALLLERGEDADVQRAQEIVETLMGLQVDAPSSGVHGQFPMKADGEVGDLNAVLFLMPALIRILELGHDLLPDKLMSEFELCMQRAIVAVERRWDEERFDLYRDFKAYTNVFLLYIQALILVGRHYGSERHERMATAQWQRWFNHISYYGIDELSPNYSNVDYEALQTIHEQGHDNQIRRESAWVLEYLSATYLAITHPVMRLPVCGSFRNYRVFLTQGNCEPNCVKEAGRCRHVSAAVRQDYESRQYPYAARGRATSAPFRFQSWHEEHAAMGTMTGGNYFWQQIHCMVAVGNSATERAVLFLPGAFTPTSGFTAQREMTSLCVFSREPNTLHRTQYAIPDDEIHAYQQAFEIGISKNWQVTVQDTARLVFSAFGYDVHVRPFAIHGEVIRPVALRREKRHNMGQKGFHKRPAEFDAFRFPDEAVRFGCLVEVCEATEAPSDSTISCRNRNGFLTVMLDKPQLEVKLFQQPSGELTECYREDWRILPLLESPAYELYPGELTRRVANDLRDV